MTKSGATVSAVAIGVILVSAAVIVVRLRASNGEGLRVFTAEECAAKPITLRCVNPDCPTSGGYRLQATVADTLGHGHLEMQSCTIPGPFAPQAAKCPSCGEWSLVDDLTLMELHWLRARETKDWSPPPWVEKGSRHSWIPNWSHPVPKK